MSEPLNIKKKNEIEQIYIRALSLYLFIVFNAAWDDLKREFWEGIKAAR